jgi:SAM-dependent methyltransferase
MPGTDHANFDRRKYPVLDVREGYAQWVRTYEQTVRDDMDLSLLERLTTIDWSASRAVVDLACGTGRVGAWLRERCAATIDGVDLTPQMLEVARAKAIYRKLIVADVTATGLPEAGYDLSIQSLADEHLPDLRPLYREAARLTRPGGHFVLVGYHPQFLMAGVPTHFERAPGEPVSIRSYVHLLSDHTKAAHGSGWSLLELDEQVIDDAWVRAKPKWQVYLGFPISFAAAWKMY